MCVRFGKHYELPLLLQSIVMIATMMAMMHVCVTVKTDTNTATVRLKGNIRHLNVIHGRFEYYSIRSRSGHST